MFCVCVRARSIPLDNLRKRVRRRRSEGAAHGAGSSDDASARRARRVSTSDVEGASTQSVLRHLLPLLLDALLRLDWDGLALGTPYACGARGGRRERSAPRGRALTHFVRLGLGKGGAAAGRSRNQPLRANAKFLDFATVRHRLQQPDTPYRHFDAFVADVERIWNSLTKVDPSDVERVRQGVRMRKSAEMLLGGTAAATRPLGTGSAPESPLTTAAFSSLDG